MTAPKTRLEALRLAEACVDDAESELRRRGRGLLSLGPASITVLRAAHRHVEHAVADRLQGNLSSTPWAKQRAYDARERAKDLLWAARGLGRFFDRGSRRPRVLAVPRTLHHLRDMVLVAEAGALDFAFVGFVAEQVQSLRAAGHSAVLAGAFAHPRFAEALRLRAELGLELLEARDLRAAILRSAEAQIVPVLVAAGAIERAIEALRPDVVLAGNPCTTEGCIAVAAAHAYGLPAAALQHGDFGPAHAEWARSGVDLICAWGEAPRDVLAGLGVDPARIAITGAPWVDRLRVEKRAQSSRHRILIATSGAGHTVGLPEHTAHVRRILEASAELPDVDFVFRLHPKDRPELYTELLRELAGAKAEIIEARKAKTDIHEALPAFDLLITVTSTSAIDAMLHELPVLTLARPPGEVPPAFVTAGATLDVPANASLAARLRAVLTEPPDAALQARARAYVQRFFGAMDGQAAARICEALRALANERTAARH